MIEKVLRMTEKCIPKKVYRFFQPYYHALLAWVGVLVYRFPSHKLVVVGVTGTKGKTTTSNFIWASLTGAGYKVGCLTTANIRTGEKEILNRHHMTMPGRMFVQRTLREFVDADCTHVIIETTSEGMKQSRHVGIAYDIAVFTNLTPEHLPSHNNSFEEYKIAKSKLFKAISKTKPKNLKVKQPNAIITNADSTHSKYYQFFDADNKITYSVDEESDYKASRVSQDRVGISFLVKDKKYTLKTIGEFNVYNALPAIIVGDICGGSCSGIKSGLSNLTIIPGRMEVIDEGQPFTVIVDYAHEKESMTKVKETVKGILSREGKWIVLLGAEGGGRDKRKRREMGEIVGKHADIVVVSNVDPYDDNEEEIIEEIVKATLEEGKELNKNVFGIVDRREGIRNALAFAKEGDVVVITGKGSEQSMFVKGKKVLWDDRQVVREELSHLGFHKN